MARAELPVFARLVAQGTRAVLDSEPPFTAVAVRTLAEPGARGAEGVLGVLHQLGAEVAGLEFVRANPAAPLGWVLPGGAGLFDTIGAGPLRAVNLLHSHGGLQVGIHGEVVGPHGARSTSQPVLERELRPEEAAIAGRVSAVDARLLRTIAADFDVTTRLAREVGTEGGADLVMLRVASLDLLTHENFPATAAPGQDDGGTVLARTYRYVDRRLGELAGALDGNDVLIVMSDHGAHTALQHDPRALFVAWGGGVPAGRVAGQPELRGVPRLLADLLGVRTAWPATGIEAWAAPLAAGAVP
jgi:hypothetical protein